MLVPDLTAAVISFLMRSDLHNPGDKRSTIGEDELQWDAAQIKDLERKILSNTSDCLSASSAEQMLTVSTCHTGSMNIRKASWNAVFCLYCILTTIHTPQ